MSASKPQQIRVDAVAQYVPEQSEPEAGRYVFAYHIAIRNEGTQAAQLLTRHWVITDTNGQIQEVRGVGVIGEQPELAPGEQFEYTSGCVIATPVGTMRGSYRMRAEDGTLFDTDIPEFLLAEPGALH
jgi:ApaG protein